MNNLVADALTSWKFDLRVCALLLVLALVYLRGWLRLHRLIPFQFGGGRLAAFVFGLLAIFVALDSPLDAFDALSLQAHMVQHLLLMLVAPPLLLIGQPFLPLLRGLPRHFVKHGLGPFLNWPLLQRVARALTWPPLCWLLFSVSTLVWHVPAAYELGLREPFWHGVQHACFFWTSLLFWWPVVMPWPSRAHWPRWAMIPYLLLGDVVNTIVSAVLVFSERLLYPSYGMLQLGGLSPRTDQAAAGLIMWIPGSFVFLVPAIVIAVRLLDPPARARQAPAHSRRAQSVTVGLVQIQPARGRAPFDLLKTPFLGALLRWRHFRRVLQAALLVAAAVVVLDGFTGSRMAPMNLAGVLPWTYWRALVVIALLVAGNLFCMACPFMLPRELAKRLLPANRRWPAKLRSKWTAAALLLLYLWAYEAFSVWNSPWITAWIVTGYFAAAFVVDGFFRGASFCKYVCPIGQFNFVNSLLSPLEVKVRDPGTCKSCATHDCIRGNARSRGCELLLFQPRKLGNLDCTFCLDCIQACPHDNVGIEAVMPGATILQTGYRSSVGRLSRRLDLAALTTLVVFGAFVNAAGMVAPFAGFEQAWRTRFGPHSTWLLVAILCAGGLVLLPAASLALAGWLTARFSTAPLRTRETASSFAFALLPIGAAMWLAHFSFHLATAWRTAAPVIQQAAANAGAAVFGPPDWAWSFAAPMPPWVTALQLCMLDTGLLATLYLTWRIAGAYSKRASTTCKLTLPWALIACGLYVAGVWVFFEPMQMRGMIMH